MSADGWQRTGPDEWTWDYFTIRRTYPRRTASDSPRKDKPRYTLYRNGKDTGRFGPTKTYCKRYANLMLGVD